ncbi:hypothetical protein BN1708_016206 [Verticillium longisporum]|uniref:Uncharacterized protein n=1 Tax=Verticillium longisporum TaxID=100787 RepID=A0A0G4MFH8_VERLO|nr:hypothetical protein BN1708_016206 [Verticillium longisporum]
MRLLKTEVYATFNFAQSLWQDT